MSDVAELMKRCQRGVGGRNALDEAHDIMAECYGTLGRLESERAALEAERDALRQQRDKLAKVLEDVEREHDLIRRMKNCEIHRGRGSFGIAVMSDPPALEWQALDKELQQIIDARRATLAAGTGQEVGK